MFTPYEKISSSPKDWLLEARDQRAISKTPWVVTEKIHGANFCFLIGEGQIDCAKRKGLLPEGEDFFGHKALLEDLRAQLRGLFLHLQASHPELVRVFVYGELFGGAYPHPEVKAVSGVQAIQTGVWYSPNITFCAFDLAITEGDDEGQRHYLDWEEASSAARKVGLMWTQPLLIGSYEDAMAYPLGFDTTIPALLGLPALTAGENKAEGVVLKPARNLLVPTRKGRLRPVLKRKIAHFAEDKRYYQSERWPEPETSPQSESWGLDMLSWELSCRIEKNRFAAAQSKLGVRSDSDTSKRLALRDLILQDVLEEVEESSSELWAACDAEERELLRAVAMDEVEALIQQEL